MLDPRSPVHGKGCRRKWLKWCKWKASAQAWLVKERTYQNTVRKCKWSEVGVIICKPSFWPSIHGLIFDPLLTPWITPVFLPWGTIITFMWGVYVTRQVKGLLRKCPYSEDLFGRQCHPLRRGVWFLHTLMCLCFYWAPNWVMGPFLSTHSSPAKHISLLSYNA